MKEELEIYDHIRNGGTGFYEHSRGLIAVWGTEAVRFLDGLITNDMKTVSDGQQMLAAFPNAQGRLLAVVRVLRRGDKFLFETEGATREKLFQNLYRFTYAGDFFVEDLSDKYQAFEIVGGTSEPGAVATGFLEETVGFVSGSSTLVFVPLESADEFRATLRSDGTFAIVDEVYETVRIERGIPKFGVDMDETTIVPELGLDGMISYNKGCYIGQEIIARIHFRGHVAKRLTGLILSEAPAGADGLTLEPTELELAASDGKKAGRVTSMTFSPKIGETIALGYVRFDYLEKGTELLLGGAGATVCGLPFVE